MIGLPHQPAASEPPPSTNSFVAMDVKEGRIGNAFACERCRKHKVRCVPSETARVCQRCQKARVECIEHVARRRPAKPRSMVQTPTRVAEMEKRLDKLSAIVTAASAPTPAPQPVLPPVSNVPPQVADVALHTPTQASSTSTPLAAPSVQTPILPNPGSTPESASSFWESINDAFSGLGRLDPALRSISIMHMQMLLDTYRTMVDFFPFAPLPKDSFCRDLLQQQPMLMFAILTATSYDSTPLQLTLSREFRKLVMIKLMNGEKSLDLLQGLLVFIAWHHHYMDPQAVSIHTLLQICIGIAGDLGLENIPRAAIFRKEDAQDREAKRAYLGCYYLSANLGILDPGRSRSIAYTSTIRNYAAELSATWEYRSDSLLPALVDACQFLEDVEETFRSQSEQALVARSQMKRLSDRWENMRTLSRQTPPDYKTLHWEQMAARVHLCNYGTSLDLIDQESVPWATGYQLSLRVTCLRSIELFLDNSLQLTTTQYEFLSLVDWVNLISAFSTLGKLSLHSPPISGWDPAELQLAKTFEQFRDQLCAQLPRPHDVLEQSEDVFERFRRVTSMMKTSLKSAISRGSPNGSSFEITTSSRHSVSILQDLPPLKPNNGSANGMELPAPWKINAQLDMGSSEFPWKCLMGTL